MARILIVARALAPDARTGRAAAFARLAERLAAEHETRWVVGWTRDRALVPDHALGVDVRGGAAGAVALWRAARQQGAALGPQLVVASGVGAPPLPWPTVSVVRDLVGTGWLRPGRVSRYERWRLRASRAVVVPTQGVRRRLRSLGVDPWRIHRVPEGLDVPPEPHPLPGRDAGLVLVHPGAIHPAKQQHLSIDAVSRLPAAIKGQVRLVIAGHVLDRRYLEQLRVSARGQPVEVRPDVPDLAQTLRGAHLVLYPTALDEGFPDTAVLAMSLGRAVATTPHPRLAEATGGVGLAVAEADAASLRDRLVEVAAGDVDLAAEGRRAHAFASSTYGWDHVWPRWRSLLTGLLR